MPFNKYSPLVSAVIASHNDAKYLTKSVKSILWQEYEPLECIVVDDGSTDETTELVKSWRVNSQLRYIRIEHKGLSVARNIGIDEAKGEFVAFLDADDRWHPSKTSNQVNFMLSNPTIDFCWCNVVLEGESDGKRTIVNGTLENIDLAKYILINGLSRAQSPSTWMVKRPLLKEMKGFSEEIYYGSDREFFFRLACNAKGANINDVLVTRLIRTNSMSQNVYGKVRLGQEVVKKMLHYKPELYSRYRSLAMHNLHVYMAGHAWTHRAWWLSFSQSLRAVYWKPSYILSSRFWGHVIIPHLVRLFRTIRRERVFASPS